MIIKRLDQYSTVIKFTNLSRNFVEIFYLVLFSKLFSDTFWVGVRKDCNGVNVWKRRFWLIMNTYKTKSIGDQVQQKYFDRFCCREEQQNFVSKHLWSTYFNFSCWKKVQESLKLSDYEDQSFLVFDWKPLDFVTDGSSPFYLQIDSSVLFQRFSFLRQKVNFQRKLLEIFSANTNF